MYTHVYAYAPYVIQNRPARVQPIFEGHALFDCCAGFFLDLGAFPTRPSLTLNASSLNPKPYLQSSLRSQREPGDGKLSYQEPGPQWSPPL